MPRALHVFKGDHAAQATVVINAQVAAGDDVTVALIGGVDAPALPRSVAVHRVPDDIAWERLLELIFEADSAVTW
jgi:hypothetical protein